MSTALFALNPFAIAAAFVCSSALGALWFTVFFVRPYRRALGRDESLATANAPIFVVGPMVTTLVTVLAQALLMQWLAIDNLADSLLLAALIGVGFLVANTVNIAINPNIPRPLFYSWITGSYQLLALVIVTVILQQLS